MSAESKAKKDLRIDIRRLRFLDQLGNIDVLLSVICRVSNSPNLVFSSFCAAYRAGACGSKPRVLAGANDGVGAFEILRLRTTLQHRNRMPSWLTGVMTRLDPDGRQLNRQ